MEVALDQHRTRANDRNVKGPRGGRPVLRRKYRQRTAQDTPSTVFDTKTDHLAAYSAQASYDVHTDDHFVEAYCRELMRILATDPTLPSAPQLWVDVKTNGGCGTFRFFFTAAVAASGARTTEARLLRAEAKERARRGQSTRGCVSEG